MDVPLNNQWHKTQAADRQPTSIKTQNTPCAAVGVTKVTRYGFKIRLPQP